MDKLPEEVLILILSHCKVKDLLSIASCNHRYNQLSKPLLWNAVAVPLNNSADIMLDNLKYTKTLTLANMGSSEEEISNERLTQILEACNPKKVEALVLRHRMHWLGRITTDMLLSMLNVLTDLRTLHIDALFWDIAGVKKTPSVAYEAARCIIQFRNLRDISMPSWFFNPLKKLLKENRLEKLKVYGYFDFDMFELISTSTVLKHLVINCARSTPDQNVTILSSLTNLQSLEIDNVHLGHKTLYNFCNAFKHLRRLCLIGICCLEDNEIADLHLLPSLKVLDISRSARKLTGHCLFYISKCLSLEKLCISQKTCICEVDESTVVVDDIYCLNSMENLKTIQIDSKDTKHVSTMVNDALCKEKDWNLRVEYGLVILSM